MKHFDKLKPLPRVLTYLPGGGGGGGGGEDSHILTHNNEPWHEISNNVVCATSKGSDQHAHTRRLIRAFASHLKYSMASKLLIEHNWSF